MKIELFWSWMIISSFTLLTAGAFKRIYRNSEKRFSYSLFSAMTSRERNLSPKSSPNKSKKKITHQQVSTLAAEFMQQEEDQLMADLGLKLESSKTLVLNADYTPLSRYPLSLWSWQDTLKAVFNEKAVVVSEYGNIVVRSVSMSFKLPSVIALKEHFRKPDATPVLTRRNLLLRDSFTCQYCGNAFVPDFLTIDHVIPRAKGGTLTWDNVACACHSCNNKKGKLLPEELHRVNMRLRMQPYEPTQRELQFKGRLWKKSKYHPHWIDFL